MELYSLCVGKIPAFDLEQTLDCGQCFRFTYTEPHGWVGVVENHPLCIREENGQIILEGDAFSGFEAYWRRYFDLDRDYPAIGQQFAHIPSIKAGMSFAPGIRILRQPAFEAMIGFIISQNNHLQRIKSIMARLCENFGEPLETPFGKLYTFPTPETLSCLREEDLAPLRSGWRAAYILDAARRVASGELVLNEIAVMPLEKARKELQKIHGVGPKVAECILLYGMGRLEAFPMDVWMKRAMKTWLPDTGPADLGEYAGIAQQYLFHYSRHFSHLLEK